MSSIGKRLSAIVLLLLVLAVLPTKAMGQAVITWGADLEPEDRVKVMELMDLANREKPARELEVTNGEEHALLGASVPASYLGTRAISSAYVRPLPVGQGLQVTTHNITWVSRRMFAQALITAGVRDAEIIAVAPMAVSGTAALTGVFKAFEAAADTELAEPGKRIAGEELYVTREVGKRVGEKQASRLVERVKEEVIRKNITDRTTIVELIRQVEMEMDLKLSPGDVEKLADLMTKLSGLGLTIEDLQIQLEKMSDQMDGLMGAETGLKSTVTSWLQRLLDLIARLIDQFLAFVAGARA